MNLVLYITKKTFINLIAVDLDSGYS